MGAVALYPVALWLVVGLLLVAGLVVHHVELAGRTLAPLAPAGLFLASAAVVSLHAAGLTAAALAVALVVTGRCTPPPARRARGRRRGGAGRDPGRRGLDRRPPPGRRPGLGRDGRAAGPRCAGPRGAVPAGRWWASDAPVLCRTGLEAGAAAAALPLGLAGVLLAPVSETASWTAVLLTVAGGLVTAMSLLRADRHALGWAGGALLALASWVRLWDVGVHQPEAYTLPSALALLVVGGVHLRRRPGAGTMTALAPGLVAGPGPQPAVGARRAHRSARAAARPGLLRPGAGRAAAALDRAAGPGRDGRVPAGAAAGGAVRRGRGAALGADRRGRGAC